MPIPSPAFLRRFDVRVPIFQGLHRTAEDHLPHRVRSVDNIDGDQEPILRFLYL
jgi:hypothetical protein